MWEKPIPPILIHNDITTTIGRVPVNTIMENPNLLEENTVL